MALAKAGDLDAALDAARRYAELGVDRLALLGMLPGERELLALIEGAAALAGAGAA
jgi:hypothetical protein